MQFGDKLQNGATVIDYNRETRIVLAHYHTSFVTWRVGTDGSTYLGNYFEHIGPAAASFDSRT